MGLMGPSSSVQTRQGFFCATPNERASSTVVLRKSLPLHLEGHEGRKLPDGPTHVRDQSGKKRQQGRRQLNGHVQRRCRSIQFLREGP